MSKPIVLTTKEWKNLLEKIKQKEKPSVYLSRSKMKEVLGFTPRNHTDWSQATDRLDYEASNSVRLDFFNEQKRTMFLLKYGNGKD